jgi:iron complex transport system substrate-binding protein
MSIRPHTCHRRSTHFGALVFLAVGTVAGAACAGERAAASDAGIDDFGDTVRIASPATRIVSLNPVTTELLFALGAGDRLVGRTRWDLHPTAAREVPDLGDGMGPNVEAVLGQRPDLVVLYASPMNRAAAQQLRRAGVMTISIRTDRVADLARVTPVLARLIGDSVIGALVVDTVNASLDALRSRTDPTRGPVAFWHVWDAPLMTIGGGSYLSELLTVAGVRNAFADATSPSPQVSIEEVARRDPDVILAGPLAAARIRAHPGWATIRAVREGRVLVVDTTLVGRPGVRMGEAARHLRALIVGDSTR